MANQNAKIDANNRKSLLAVDDSTGELRRLKVDSNGRLLCSATVSGGGGSGDVNGPASSTDNAIARFDGTGGKTLQNSGVTVDDSNNVAGAASLTVATGAGVRTGTAATNTLLLQAYDVDGAAYTTFITLTANNTPTRDLSTSVTIGGNAIYYAGGTDVAIADGGTGASTAGDARTNLGLAIGSDVQAFGAVLDDLNTLGAPTTDGQFIVATGAGAFAYESGATARTSLGLGSLATASTISNDDWSGTDLTVANGGTGRSSHTAYAVLCGGTTTTGAQQSIAGVGTSGQVLTSNGAGALPTFQDAAGGSGDLNDIVSTWAQVPYAGGFYNLADTNSFTHATDGNLVDDRASIIRLGSSNSSGSGATISQDTDVTYISDPWDQSQTWKSVCWVKETTSQDCFWGLGNSAATGTTVAANGTLTAKHIGFFVDNGTIWASNADGTTQTRTDVSSGITLASYNTYEWTKTSSTNIVFSINGTTVATHTTNLPATNDNNYGIAVGIETQTSDFRTMQIARGVFHAIDLSGATGI